MNRVDSNYLRWLVSKYLNELGFWGTLGMALLVGSLIVYTTKTATLNEQIKQAESKLNKSNLTPLKEKLPSSTSTLNMQQEVARFYRVFPSGASLPRSLSLIADIASNRHLTLDRGDYKLTQSKQGQLSRYEIVFPVSGNYSKIRYFIADVLLRLPELALSDLQIKRENTLSPNVEAKLVFVLFLQGDSW